MKNQFQFLTIIVLLAIVAVGSRLLMSDWPNFKPVFAIAVFLGFFCQNRILATVSVMSMMLVSDAAIGFYQTPLMAAVYLSLIFAVGFGVLCRRILLRRNTVAGKFATTSACLLAVSVQFFLITNIAVCLLTPWYPNTIQGASQALVAGLPFLKYTMAGDLLFGSLIFATYFAFNSNSQAVRQSSTANSFDSIKSCTPGS